MPFDEEDTEQPSVQSQKLGLKNVSSQKSIFDSMPKKPTQEDLDRKVKNSEERKSGYRVRAADLATQFNKCLADKTLPENKNIFQNEMEKEIMTKMVQLAIDINNDPAEQEGMGSLGWITLLMRTVFKQRDKINKLEYAVLQLEKRTNPATLSETISKEISKALDANKKSE
jgi:hypothetical protein